MKCGEKDCVLVAGYAPQLCVPAINDIRELQLTFGLGLCYKHIKQIQLKDFLTADIKKLFEIGWRNERSNGAPVIQNKTPDFSRAYIKPILITSKELQIIADAKKAREEKEDGSSNSEK